MRDTLFLLKPNFQVGDDGKKYFCPHCAQVEGVLSFYPFLRDKLDVVYVDFRRPRKPIVDLIGDQNQDAPVLVVGDPSSFPAAIPHGVSQGHTFVSGEDAIADYLTERYGIGHGH
jgi:hypothetical protein